MENQNPTVVLERKQNKIVKKRKIVFHQNQFVERLNELINNQVSEVRFVLYKDDDYIEIDDDEEQEELYILSSDKYGKIFITNPEIQELIDLIWDNDYMVIRAINYSDEKRKKLIDTKEYQEIYDDMNVPVFFEKKGWFSTICEDRLQLQINIDYDLFN